MKTRKTSKAKWVAGLAAVVMVGSAQALPVAGQGTWDDPVLGLQGRDLDDNAANGPEAFYDPQLMVTWLRAASTARGNWATQKAWAEQDRYGVSGWRLPTVRDIGNDGCNFGYSGTDCGYNVDATVVAEPGVDSEMAHLFYVTLGNKAFCDTSGNCPQAGWGLTNTGDFQNLQSIDYWSGTVYAPDPSNAWRFDTTDGYQSLGSHPNELYAVAVRSGDVAAVVPEVQTYAMLLAGLGALAVVVRRRPV
ncbi:MAG: DUF1566 domain-containing protein [Burkholderiaceae bacterium]|nr:DUF1566 domain-containing protein [Burkholderiaceae bacterium]